MKIPVKYLEQNGFLEPDSIYSGRITSIKEVHNDFFDKEKDDEIKKKSLAIQIETTNGVSIVQTISKIVSYKSILGSLLIALNMFTDDVSEIDTEKMKEKMFKFTTKKGKALINQKTKEPLKDNNGNIKYFAKIDKFYDVDATIQQPSSTPTNNPTSNDF